VTRGASARLFAAVDPPPEAGAELCAWARALPVTRSHRPLRVLEPDSLHLTLCFLGSRPVADIDAIAETVERSAGPLGELRVGAPVLLPPRRPRALALEVHDDGGLGRLYGRLLAELAILSDWRPERRRLRPHITVARMRGDARTGLPPTLAAPAPALAFSPHSLVLYRSWLAPAGARYEALVESELPGAPG
jgi:2'-5' RNA ligase